jgi:hypothetical protein
LGRPGVLADLPTRDFSAYGRLGIHHIYRVSSIGRLVNAAATLLVTSAIIQSLIVWINPAIIVVATCHKHRVHSSDHASGLQPFHGERISALSYWLSYWHMASACTYNIRTPSVANLACNQEHDPRTSPLVGCVGQIDKLASVKLIGILTSRLYLLSIIGLAHHDVHYLDRADVHELQYAAASLDRTAIVVCYISSY